MPSKRGLCWPSTTTDPLTLFTSSPTSKISWLYNWSPSPSPPSSIPSSISFIPMTWNPEQFSDLKSTLEAHPEINTILGFNEPERADQANLPVEKAVEAWMEVVEPLRKEGKIRAGSPAISSTEEGIDWLQKFAKGVREKGGDVDFWGVHWFGETLGQFYDYIWSTHARLGNDKPVWITEFASTSWNPEAPLSTEAVETFARESFKYLDTLDWVERYAWFAPTRDPGTVGKGARMIDDDGNLTPLGKEYVEG